MGANRPAYDLRNKESRYINPLDTIEEVCGNRDWAWERGEDDALILFSGNKWTDFRLAINYLPDSQALQLMLLFDPKVPETRQAEVLRLLALANSRNWLGHFDWWEEERAVMFRYGLPLRGAALAPRQCEDVIDLALEACEMFFPALQYVLWSGLGSDEAMRLCQMQTVGEA